MAPQIFQLPTPWLQNLIRDKSEIEVQFDIPSEPSSNIFKDALGNLNWSATPMLLARYLTRDSTVGVFEKTSSGSAGQHLGRNSGLPRNFEWSAKTPRHKMNLHNNFKMSVPVYSPQGKTTKWNPFHEQERFEFEKEGVDQFSNLNTYLSTSWRRKGSYNTRAQVWLIEDDAARMLPKSAISVDKNFSVCSSWPCAHHIMRLCPAWKIEKQSKSGSCQRDLPSVRFVLRLQQLGKTQEMGQSGSMWTCCHSYWGDM